MSFTNITTDGTPVDLGYTIDGRPAKMLIKTIPELKPGDTVDLGIGKIYYNNLDVDFRANNVIKLNNSILEPVPGKLNMLIQYLHNAIQGVVMGNAAYDASWDDANNIEVEIGYKVNGGMEYVKNTLNDDLTITTPEIISGSDTVEVTTFKLYNKQLNKKYKLVKPYVIYQEMSLFQEVGKIENAVRKQVEGVDVYVDSATGVLECLSEKDILLRDTNIKLIYTQ